MKTGHPLRTTLRDAATGMLQVNPALDEALAREFRASVPGHSLISLVNQRRHPDWKENLGVTSLPEGPTLTLYHFTSVVHLPLVLRHGVAKGDVCYSMSDQDRNINAPWLTRESSFDHPGSWHEGGRFDKRAVRLTVLIPENDPALWPWVDEMSKADEDTREFMWTPLVGDIAQWFVYNGRIPREWITDVTYREARQRHEGWGIGSKTSLGPTRT